MLGFFLDGTLFWVFLSLMSIGLLATTQNDSAIWSSILIIAVLVVTQFFSPYHPFPYVIQHPLYAGIGVLLYVALGIGWMVLKWRMYTNRLVRKSDEFKTAYMRANPSTSKSALDYAVKEHLGVSYLPPAKDDPDDYKHLEFVGKHKSAIYTWMIFWLFSMIGTVFNIRRMYDYIYDRMVGVLVSISKRASNR